MPITTWSTRLSPPCTNTHCCASMLWAGLPCAAVSTAQGCICASGMPQHSTGNSLQQLAPSSSQCNGSSSISQFACQHSSCQAAARCDIGANAQCSRGASTSMASWAPCWSSFQFGPGYSVLSEYGGDACGDIAAVTPLWCRSNVCIAELRAPVHDAKLSKLPSAFTCFGQQVSVSVQPSILAKAHAYQQRAQAQPTEVLSPASVQSPRQKRRRAQKARAQQAALRQHPQQHQWQHLQLLQSRFTPAIAAQDSLPAGGRLALSRALDPVSDLGGQHGRAGLGHSATVPMQVEQVQPPLDQVSLLAVHAPETASASNDGVAPMQTSAAQPDSDASALSQSMVDASMPQAAPPPLPP